MYGDKKEMTKEMKWRRFKNHYSEFLPINKDEEVKDRIKEKFKEVEFKENNIIIFSEEDLLKPIMVYAFLKVNKFIEYDFISFYEIIEEFFDDNSEGKLSDLNRDYLIIYSGMYSEVRNEMLPELICQLIERRTIDDKFTWIYYRGKETIFKRKYELIYKFIGDKGFNLISVGENKKDKDIY